MAASVPAAVLPLALPAPTLLCLPALTEQLPAFVLPQRQPLPLTPHSVTMETEVA